MQPTSPSPDADGIGGLDQRQIGEVAHATVSFVACKAASKLDGSSSNTKRAAQSFEGGDGVGQFRGQPAARIVGRGDAVPGQNHRFGVSQEFAHACPTDGALKAGAFASMAPHHGSGHTPGGVVNQAELRASP